MTVCRMGRRAAKEEARDGGGGVLFLQPELEEIRF